MKCTINVKDEVNCVVAGLNPRHVDLLVEKFSKYVDGYRFMPAFKIGKWNGKISFFENTGKTYVRLLPEIIEALDKFDYEFDIIDNREFHESPTLDVEFTEYDEGIATKVKEQIEIFPNEINGRPIHLRPYQLQAVKTAVEAGGGFVIAGTGAGKTLLTGALSYLYNQLGYKVITIVPSTDLVVQTGSFYELAGIDTGYYSGSNKDLEHQSIVATWQSLQNQPKVLEQFQVVIWDESHGAKADVAKKLLNEAAKNASFKFGVTGTFPKPEADKYNLYSSIGYPLIEIPAHWLMKHGYLAKLQIQPVELIHENVEEEFSDYAAENSFTIKSIPRMEMIANAIVSQAAKYGNTLVLVKSVSFGEKLAKLIKGAVFLYGDSPNDLRKEHYDMFENANDLIVIATYGIASTGISIDRIFLMMMIDPGKSFIKAIQSVGRSLRIGHDKKEATVIDMFSKLKWGKKHWRDRLKYYKEAQYTVLKSIGLKV